MPGVSRDEVLARELERIRGVVQRNIPRHGDPEKFHDDKSEITGDLTKLIRDLRAGRTPSPG